MKTSVIILNWNGDGDECVAACRSVLMQTRVVDEIIFVDNGSDNDSTDLVRQQCPEVNVIYSGKNLGVAGGRNFGAAVATGDLLFFLENDGVWESDAFVKDAVAAFEDNADMAVMYSVVVGYHDGGMQTMAYDAATPELTLAARFSGGACIIRRDVFERLGGFPGDYFRQGEERYFALLVYEAGYKICYWTRHRLLHKGSSYAGKSRVVMRMNFENEMRTIARLFPSQNFLPLFLLKLGAWALRFAQAKDLTYFAKCVTAAPGWLSERSRYPHISLQTLALTEAITDGLYAYQPASQVHASDLRSLQKTPGIIRGFFARWHKRHQGVLPS